MLFSARFAARTRKEREKSKKMLFSIGQGARKRRFAGMDNGMNKRELDSYKSLNKADIVLIAVCLLSALGSAFLLKAGMGAGNKVSVSCDGKVIYTDALDSPKDIYYLVTYFEDGCTQERTEQYPTIPENVSYNLLHIANGTVTMEAADCKDQICVRHRPIAANRENIICLPHRMVVEITGDSGREDNAEDLDGMVK